MVKVKSSVIHDGKEYLPGETIKKLSKEQADRLVKLGAAFFVEKNQSDSSIDLEKELDKSFSALDLKEAADQVGLEFEGNIKKKDLIQLIIDEELAEKVLELASGDE